MKEHWTKLGFVLAAIGSAVGLGNIWRFPYMVGENGGGAFLIPYIIGIILLAFPVMLIETAMGRKFKGSSVKVFEKINKNLKYVGIFIVIVMLSILSYYLVIAGWTLGFSVFSIFGNISFSLFTSSLLPVVTFLIVLSITGWVVHEGIHKGIEKLCKFLIPILLIILTILVVNSLSLPGAIEGVKFYLSPNFSSLLNPSIWLVGFSQAFFSLSVGTAILLTYGSHLTSENIKKNAIEIITADTSIALLAGLIIFPIVFSFGASPSAGPKLVFVTLPQIFSTMIFGNVFGFLFFVLLLIGALTSTVSMMEVGVASFMDKLKFKRAKATKIITILVGLAALPSLLSYTNLNLAIFGKPILDVMDVMFGSMFLPLAAALLTIGITWFIKPKTIIKAIDKNSKTKTPKILIYITKYIVPIILISLFVFEIFSL